MDFTDRCHYCNNCINSRNGYGMYEHHTVTNDIRICNNMTQNKCLPFHPIGKILYAIEEDMPDIANTNKATFEMIFSNKNSQYDFIKFKVLETIFKLNIGDKVIRYFNGNLNIKNIINSSNQVIKHNILDKLAIFLEYYNINKNFIKKTVSFFSKFNKVLTFNESYNKKNIDITILKGNSIVKFKLPKTYDSQKKIYNLSSTNNLLYA